MKTLIIAALLAFSVSSNADTTEECDIFKQSTEIVNSDPTPEAHDGLGCITDSECEGTE